MRALRGGQEQSLRGSGSNFSTTATVVSLDRFLREQPMHHTALFRALLMALTNIPPVETQSYGEA